MVIPMSFIDKSTKRKVRIAFAILALTVTHWAWSQNVSIEITAKEDNVWYGITDEELDTKFPPDLLYPGLKITEEQCKNMRLTVWVSHEYGTECIRYYPSKAIKNANRVAFFFHGDLLGGTVPVSSYQNQSPRSLIKDSNGYSAANKMPFILVARPGAFGSSGEHASRRRPKEYYSLLHAVNAIKLKHNINQAMLVGQSGGAAVVGALLTLGIEDVPCAIGTSGPYDALARASRRGYKCDITGHCDIYNITDHVATVKAESSRRIFLIGDLMDTNTPFDLQREFYQKIVSAGHKVNLVEANGAGPEHHALGVLGIRAAGWCNAGLPDELIIENVRAGKFGIGDPRSKREN